MVSSNASRRCTLTPKLHTTREPASSSDDAADGSTSTLDISDESYDPNRDLEFLTKPPSSATPSDANIWCLESLQKLVMAIGPSSPYFLRSLLLTGQFEAVFVSVSAFLCS